MLVRRTSCLPLSLKGVAQSHKPCLALGQSPLGWPCWGWRLGRLRDQNGKLSGNHVMPVSYTHLTLPTTAEV